MLRVSTHFVRFGLLFWFTFVAQVSCLLADDGNERQDTAEAHETIDFSRDISPILSENCYACHGFDEAARESGLRLDTFEGATGADGGPDAIVPGAADESELISRILSSDPDTVMPPPDSGRKLSAKQIQLLRKWVQEGARYAEHWSFKPVEPVSPPVVADVTHPVDRFIHTRLAEENLSPASRASSHTLIRRLYLDLIGLPPTIQEVEEFSVAAEEDFDAAYERLIDRLLASSHYGERWGRWWLDQARYADSNGYSIDGPREIWAYRDWVVDALNQDMPFDQFTIEQLAGDLLPDATPSQQIATGFHRNTQINQEGGIDKEQFRIDSVFDRVATTGTVWLGLSVGCAQCHDHKFDPISQVEYYRMFAFLNDQDEPTMKVFESNVDVEELTKRYEEAKSELAVFLDADQQQNAVETWEDKLADDKKASLASKTRKALEKSATSRSVEQKRDLLLAVGDAASEESREEFAKLDKRFRDMQSEFGGIGTTLVLRQRDKPRKTTVLIKGDFTRPDAEVEPGTLSVLHPLNKQSDRANRMDLAKWIVSPENPLTARVIVNRIWMQYFGRGIVESENDFGLQGSTPSHPELLDWLANEFVEQNWSIKKIHRLIVTSHTYQQSSINQSEGSEPGAADKRDQLLGRQQRLRLDAEIVRDVALSISGLFAPKIGGPPVFPPIPEGVMGQGQVKRNWSTSQGPDRYRRGLYTFMFRATPAPSLNVFDAPDGLSACTRRNRSNTPLQALTLMNDPSFFEFATALEKIVKQDGLKAAFRKCTAREPTKEELEVLVEMDTLNAARALLNLDETITRE